MWIFKSLSSREFRFGRCLCLCFYCAMRTEKWLAGLFTTSALVFLPPFPLAAAALHVAVLPKCKRDRPTRRSSTASPSPHSVSWAWMRHLFIVFLISWQTAWIYSLLRLGTWMTVHSHNKRKSGEGGFGFIFSIRCCCGLSRRRSHGMTRTSGRPTSRQIRGRGHHLSRPEPRHPSKSLIYYQNMSY